MWYLISLENPDVKYTLLANQTYVVGRKNCDILLSGDAAVSRKHAEIALIHPETNITKTEKLPTVTLTDVSKFGSSVNGDKVETNVTKDLHDGDMVLFGNNSNFTLVYEPFIISSSCLDLPSKKKVRELITILGGHIVNDWKKECSLLVMNNISVTIKVVCALLSLKHIVTPDYLEKYVKYLKKEGEKPNPSLYLPVVTETQVESNDVSFGVVPERRNIFQGMKFIFLNDKQFKKLHMAVELGGGLPVLLEEKYKNDKMLIEKGSVVMQCDPNNCTQMMSQNSHNWILHVQSYLNKNKKHMIQDAEVGYAVLYCSTEKHCNPDTDAGSQVLKHVPSQSVSNTDILVANTEVSPDRSPTRIRKKKCETVLDETKFDKQGNSQAEQSTDRRLKQERKNPFTGAGVSDSVTGSDRIGKRVREEVEEEIVEVTQSKKKIKQEVLSQSVTENESRKSTASSRRSPSPSTRTSPRRRRNVSPDPSNLRKSPSPKTRSSPRQLRLKSNVKVKHEIVEDSDEDISVKSKKGHVIVEDSDDEFPDFNNTRTVRGKTRSNKDNSSQSGSRNNGNRSLSQSKTVQKIDSDEDFPTSNLQNQRPTVKTETLPTPRSKSKHISDSDSDRNIQSNLETKSSNKRKVIVDDSDEEIDVKPRGKKKQAENSDDEFDRLMSVKKRKTQIPAEDNTSNSDTSKNRNRNSPQRESIGQLPVDTDNLNGPTVKTEVNDKEDQNGFVSTQNQDGESKNTDYIKEEDLPSKCINIKFVDLVARKPCIAAKPTNEGVPEGYVRWKGKIIRNFKKFRKTENAGANALPRIIGGSDLVAHNSSNRKDLDDWFKEAIQAESQQNETERKAKELFDWEPGKKRSR